MATSDAARSSRPASAEDAQEARILAHMNKQHSISLTRYLQHYIHLSSFAACNPEAVAINNSAVAVVAHGYFSETRHVIPFDPPLASLADARHRFVEMDKQAMKALAQKPQTVTRYIPPNTPFQITVLASVFLGLAAFSRPENFLPGSWLTATILRFTPSFARLCYQYQPVGLGLIIAIHLVEAQLLASRKLAYHSVPTGSRLWLLWVVSAFCEGAGAFVRFNAEVSRLDTRREEDSARH